MRVASNLFILMALCLEERFKVTFYNSLLVFAVLHQRLGFMFYIYIFSKHWGYVTQTPESSLRRHIKDKASVHTQDGSKPGRAGLEIGASHMGYSFCTKLSCSVTYSIVPNRVLYSRHPATQTFPQSFTPDGIPHPFCLEIPAEFRSIDDANPGSWKTY